MTQRLPHQRRAVTCECGERYCAHCASICPACHGVHLSPEKPIGDPLYRPQVVTPFTAPIRMIEELTITSVGVVKDGTLGVAGIIKRSTSSEQAHQIGEIRKAAQRYETALDWDDR